MSSGAILIAECSRSTRPRGLDDHGVKLDEGALAFVNLLLQGDLATESKNLVLDRSAATVAAPAFARSCSACSIVRNFSSPDERETRP